MYHWYSTYSSDGMSTKQDRIPEKLDVWCLVLRHVINFGLDCGPLQLQEPTLVFPNRASSPPSSGGCLLVHIFCGPHFPFPYEMTDNDRQFITTTSSQYLRKKKKFHTVPLPSFAPTISATMNISSYRTVAFIFPFSYFVDDVCQCTVHCSSCHTVRTDR
jgi:hypothetical protein